MLYLSTRNTTDAYTAHRVLHEERALDGGMYIPFRLPVFSAEELQSLKGRPQGEIIAFVLNHFFGTQLTAWDVEGVVGRVPLKSETVNHRILFVECWRNPASSFDYLITSLYALLTGKASSLAVTRGWARIAIGIALYFAVYGSVDWEKDGLDLAVPAGDFADISAALYAKDMGLPLNTLICTCNGNSAIWDLINKGEFNTNASVITTQLPKLDISCPYYMELFIYQRFGREEVEKYLDACSRKAVYRLGAELTEKLNRNMFASVISADRIDAIINGLISANGYTVDPYTALAYCGLQDYRSYTCINKDTLILALHRPQRDKE